MKWANGYRFSESTPPAEDRRSVGIGRRTGLEFGIIGILQDDIAQDDFAEAHDSGDLTDHHRRLRGHGSAALRRDDVGGHARPQSCLRALPLRFPSAPARVRQVLIGWLVAGTA